MENSFLNLKFIIIFCISIVSTEIHAQLGFCQGNSGDPIFTENFGTGTTYGPQLPVATTTYSFVGFNGPQDGEYTIGSNTFAYGWNMPSDHTIGDTNGKALIVNASFTTGEFYTTSVTGLCENTTYEFSSWLLNILPSSGCGGNGIPANVQFEIWDITNTSLLASGDTGNIFSSATPTWLQYGLVFQTLPGQTSIILKMINNGAGGCGNDLAIDDIVFKTCGDLIALADTSNNDSVTLCSSQAPYSDTITALPDGSVFGSYFYQWQVSTDGIIWTDVVGETNASIAFTGITTTTYYRTKVAEFAANLSNSDCITFSDEYQILVNPSPNVPVSSGDSSLDCITNSTNISVTGVPTGIIIDWYDAATAGTLLASGSTSLMVTMPGNYYAEARNAVTGCLSASRVEITVTGSTLDDASFNAVPAICSGDTLTALPTTSTNGITGTWSPALNNTTTTTYTFTPAASECALATTLTINVNPIITPTFTAVPAICSGDALTILPTTSINGVTGTWSPALDNTTTTTYTFTPAASECALTTTLTINVSSGVTPTFTAVPAICEGDVLTALPTTSDNGIIGTWSPALDNTITTTYTFTPATSSCASTTSLTITVNPSATPTFTAIPAICVGETLSALPTTSDNGIIGTWSPALDNTTTTTYTFTPSGSVCSSVASLTITVNPSATPTFTAVPAICVGETLSALPTTSDNGITGTWSPALDNTTTTTYTFTPSASECAVATTLTISVNTSVMPTFTAVPAICEGDVLTALPMTSDNGIIGTWSPALDNTTTTTYTFTPATSECASATSLIITVNPSVTPTFTAVPAICEGDSLTALPTISDNSITGTWSPALDNTTTTTYTFTPATSECASATSLTITVNPSVTPTFTAVPAICEGDVLTALPTISDNGITGTWSPALDNTTTTTYTFTPASSECASATSLTITVNPKVTPTFTIVPAICAGDVLTALPTISDNGITGGWSPALDNTTTTTYTFTPAASECAVAMSLVIEVTQLPAVVAVTDYRICELMSDGIDSFDLTSKDEEVLGGQNPTRYVVTYHESRLEAESQVGALASPYTNLSNPQQIFVTITDTNTGCFISTQSFNLYIDEGAIANSSLVPILYEICDDSDDLDADATNDSTQFDLSTQNDQVLDGQNPSDYIVTYFAIETDANLNVNPLPNLYENISNPQIIYARVDNNTLRVIPIALNLSALTTGLDLDANGTIDTYDTNADSIFDLIDVDGDGLSDATDSNGDGIFEFVDIDGDGQGDPVDLNNDGTFDNLVDGSICFDVTELTLQVNPLPEINLDELYILCLNTNGTEVIDVPVIDTELSSTAYSFEWSFEGTILPGETGSSLQPTQGGNYSVVVTDISSSSVTSCINMDSTVVMESEPPILIAEVITELFGESNIIEAMATGIGDYEYSLDNGPWQDSGVFTNVSAGLRVITSRDKIGCGFTFVEVFVIDYPLYFTPNGDGNNDTWNIVEIGDDALIYIFDRYGKLLKQLSPSGEGWNGTFNGNLMPTSDYWFKLIYTEPTTGNSKEFKANFTLKR